MTSTTNSTTNSATTFIRQPLGRASRRGVTLRLGSLIALKVAVFSAVAEDKESALKTVCDPGTHPISTIRQRTYCPVCDADTGFAKARLGAEGLQRVKQEDLDAVQAAEMAFYKEIELTVHPASEVSAVMQPSGKSYYLNVEDSAGSRLYAVLAQTIAEHPDLAFMARFTLKSAASAFRLVISGDNTMVLQQQASPQLVREMPVVAAGDPLPAEMQFAATLVEALVEPFDPASMVREKGRIISEAVAGMVAVPVGTIGESGGLSDLTSAFAEAVRLAKEARGETPVKAPARRRAAKKAVPAAKAS